MRLPSRRDTTDRELIRRAAAGDELAIELLAYRHLAPGISRARFVAGPSTSNENILDAVHDAFITAFDETLEGSTHDLGAVYDALLTEFSLAIAAQVDDWAEDDHGPVSVDMMDQLQRDVVAELRLTVDLRAELPRGRRLAWTFVQRLRELGNHALHPVGRAGDAHQGDLRILVR